MKSPKGSVLAAPPHHPRSTLCAFLPAPGAGMEIGTLPMAGIGAAIAVLVTALAVLILDSVARHNWLAKSGACLPSPCCRRHALHATHAPRVRAPRFRAVNSSGGAPTDTVPAEPPVAAAAAEPLVPGRRPGAAATTVESAAPPPVRKVPSQLPAAPRDTEPVAGVAREADDFLSSGKLKAGTLEPDDPVVVPQRVWSSPARPRIGLLPSASPGGS